MKKNRQKISVKFHSEIYKMAAVKEAASTYSDFARVTLSVKGSYIEAVIIPKDEFFSARLKEEFSNRALFNSI